MHREYQVATNSAYTTTPYDGTFSDYIGEPWSERQLHLAAPYGHDVYTYDEQQYYEMIGKYFDQFGYGWRDTYDNSIESSSQWNSGDVGPIWSNPSAGYYDDYPNDTTHVITIQFDGRSPWFFQYRDMRGEANDLLNKGNIGMEVVLVNHILSALDAAFTVRSYNKKHEAGPLGNIKLRYEAQAYNGDVARCVRVSIPLN
jgi:hypothetical protein